MNYVNQSRFDGMDNSLFNVIEILEHSKVNNVFAISYAFAFTRLHVSELESGDCIHDTGFIRFVCKILNLIQLHEKLLQITVIFLQRHVQKTISAHFLTQFI